MTETAVFSSFFLLKSLTDFRLNTLPALVTSSPPYTFSCIHFRHFHCMRLIKSNRSKLSRREKELSIKKDPNFIRGYPDQRTTDQGVSIAGGSNSNIISSRKPRPKLKCNSSSNSSNRNPQPYLQRCCCFCNSSRRV